MSDREDGGSAFPTLEVYEGYNRDLERHEVQSSTTTGMSLRDYFAAKAMHAALANEAMLARIGKRVSNDVVLGHADMAAGAYAMADAMLKEREK